MEILGWVCGGLVGLIVLLVVLFYLFVILPYNQEQKRLNLYGQKVVGKIFLANPSLYETEAPAAFEGAFVVFTRDNDSSERHLAFLQGMIDRLEDGFTPDAGNADEEKIAWALETQRTVGYAIRLPDRVTGGKEVYFATPTVKRKLLPEGRLTRDFLCLRIYIEGKYRDAEMIEYPDAPVREE